MNKKGLGGWLLLAIIFLAVALISGILGFGIISGFSFTLARWMAMIFVILFVISVIAHVIKEA